MNNMERQSTPNYIDSISKVVATLIAVGGFIWGIIEFQQRQLYNETHEFRRRLWENRLETYTRLQDVTGLIIVKRNDSKALDSLQSEFDRLYYSAMIIVEDQRVEAKMVELSEALRDFKDGVKKESFLKKKQIELMRELSISLKRKQNLLFDEN